MAPHPMGAICQCPTAPRQQRRLLPGGCRSAPRRLRYRRFASIADPAGNRIELWEPPKESEGACCRTGHFPSYCSLRSHGREKCGARFCLGQSGRCGAAPAGTSGVLAPGIASALYSLGPAGVPVVDVDPAPQARAVVHDNGPHPPHEEAGARLSRFETFVVIERTERPCIPRKLEHLSANHRWRISAQDCSRILSEIKQPSPHRRRSDWAQTAHRSRDLRRRMPR